jgi:hypothetical protein
LAPAAAQVNVPVFAKDSDTEFALFAIIVPAVVSASHLTT